MGNGSRIGEAYRRTEKNILRNKIHRDGLQFPSEVIDYIAENVNESVRDLEGIVISIMAHSTITIKKSIWTWHNALFVKSFVVRQSCHYR